jgi:hypothetical protein
LPRILIYKKPSLRKIKLLSLQIEIKKNDVIIIEIYKKTKQRSIKLYISIRRRDNKLSII